MNNLLQSLSNQRLRLHVQDNDLKRLLSAVKDGRGHDAKLQDAFYDSLEGVLVDLRTVTIDNRDAEAFLKPVSKSEYPDYYEIIKEPMDLQTMLRKVKQKQYKSKAEFQDDLELIWSNCFVYNTGDNHPLRHAAKRLQAKANRLLKNVTDRRDRLDPPVPIPASSVLGDGGATPKPNGVMVNGHGHGPGHSRKQSGTGQKMPIVIKKSAPSSRMTSLAPPSPPARPREPTFGDQPAFVRSAAGMSAWAALDRELEMQTEPSNLDIFPFDSENVHGNINSTANFNSNVNGAGPSRLPVTDKLRHIISNDTPSSDEDDYPNTSINGIDAVNGDVGIGEKRKLAINGDIRPRKKARTRLRLSLSSFDSQSEGAAGVDPVELWWDASNSSTLMANALPTLSYSSSFTLEPPPPPLRLPLPSIRKRKVKKRKKGSGDEQQSPPPKSLLGLINNNIRTLRRVRQIHDKFLALNLSSGDDNSSTTGPVPAGGPGLVPVPGPSIAPGISMSGFGEPPDTLGGGVSGGSRSKPGADDLGKDTKDWDLLAVDDRPWRSRGVGIRGLELGERDASDCLRWMGMKVLEHSGFQSTSRSALDVFTGVATEYMFNVGRTLRYLCDKYSKKMSAEEIVLHTLFESGITHIRDLERYITDDVMRYGTKLTELEKKLANAYNEVAVEPALDDDAFFNEDDEEDSELVMGNFAEAFGDDFLGLRELGIAGELGLQSLTIPKKLLRTKNKQRDAQKGAKPSEPPPPFPPPPPFTSLDSLHVDNQIGLLRSFYITRFNSYASKTHPQQPPPFIQPPPTQPSQLDIELAREMGTEPPVPQAPPPVRNVVAPTVVLPDDTPPAGRTKSGPLGQIMRPSTGGGAAAKKKVKTATTTGGGPGGSGGGSGGGGGSKPPASTPAPVPVGVGMSVSSSHQPPHQPIQAAPVYGYPMQMQMQMTLPPNGSAAGHAPPTYTNTQASFSVPLHGPGSTMPHQGHEATFVVLPGSAGVPPPSGSAGGGGEGGKKSAGGGGKKKGESGQSGGGGGGGGSSGMPQFVGVGVNA